MRTSPRHRVGTPPITTNPDDLEVSHPCRYDVGGRDRSDGRFGRADRSTARGAHHKRSVPNVRTYRREICHRGAIDGYGRVNSSTDARYLGASAHAVRIIETAEQLAAEAGEG